MEKYDFSGWATRNDLLCADGLIIRKDAFKCNDGETVPLVYNHDHSNIDNILGHALLKNRDEGVYAYCTFNDSESGQAAKEAVRHGDVKSLSIYANKLKQAGNEVLHGVIREVSIVMAGANPGAFIDSVMVHGEDTEEGFIVGYDENIMIHHYAEEDEPLQHVEPMKEDTNKVDNEFNKDEEKIEHAEPKEEMKEESKAEPKEAPKEKTVKDVFDTLTEEQKNVVYALIGQALEDAKDEMEDEKEDKKEDKNEDMKHSEGGNEIMHTNVFEKNDEKNVNVLTHSDQAEIIEMAKRPGMTLKSAMAAFADDHKDTLAHGFESGGIGKLFPDYKDAQPGAPELIERDHSWVGSVMQKARKSPVSRVRTRKVDARAQDIRAKGYSKRETEKAISGNLKVLMRTTDPQTIYYRDTLHRDDVIDITDFDVVDYQRNVMKNALEEEIALAALVGDGRDDLSPDKIAEDHIRPVWKDDDLYTIKALVDVSGMKTKLQGTNTSANFGDEFVYAEAVIAAVMKARIKYRGSGTPDLFVEPNMLNTMLLARDMNGRRIYESASDLAKVLNVGAIHTVEQFADLAPRTGDAEKKFKLLGLIVNMASYQFGSTKGGEITSFEDFDIDFNAYKYLMETRLSGALVDVYSAIAIEEDVTAAG